MISIKNKKTIRRFKKMDISYRFYWDIESIVSCLTQTMIKYDVELENSTKNKGLQSKKLSIQPTGVNCLKSTKTKIYILKSKFVGRIVLIRNK